MKATGIVRRIDDLGRVVVPKEIHARSCGSVRAILWGNLYRNSRRSYPEKIFTHQRTWADSREFRRNSLYCAGASCTDFRYRPVHRSRTRKKDYLNQQIDTALDEIIQCKEKSRTASKTVVPILTNGDPIGSVTVLPTESHALTEAEVKTAELGAKLPWHARWRIKKERPHMAQGMSCHFARRSLFSVDPVKLRRLFGRFVHSCSR